ncbi:MAG: chorismate-binding protein, partial [Ferruginibacter sp.]|nr:chorismate-binding protein [Ferruginibacter sp.]
IRSIFYDEENQKLSYAAGGGITFNSIAENEYEESLLKAAAIKQVLENQ